MHKALHARDDIDWLYMPRKEGGRGVASIEDSVDTSIQQLKDYIQKCGGRLITATRNNTDNMRTNRTTITRKEKWVEKQLYGHFKQQVSNISHKKIWTWLRKGNLMRETESVLIAGQNNAIRSNHIKARTNKMQQNSKCRLCGERDESIKLTQKEYKTRHNWAGKVIHWELCKKF